MKSLVAACLIVAFLPATRCARGDNPRKTNANRLAYLNGTDAYYLGNAVEGFAATAWNAEQSLGQLVVIDLSRVASKLDLVKPIVARLNRGELPGCVLRIQADDRSPYRLVDLNGDKALDIVGGPGGDLKTLLWSQKTNDWELSPFPAEIALDDCRWAIMRPDGSPCLLVRSIAHTGAWHFVGGKWVADPRLLSGLESNERRVLTSVSGQDQGVRLYDLDGDGICELLAGNPSQRAVFRWAEPQGRWQRLGFDLPSEVTFVDFEGGDAGLRLADVDQDGKLDLVMSNRSRYSIHLLSSIHQGWAPAIVSSTRENDAQQIMPLIARDGKPTGAWYDARRQWVFTKEDAQSPMRGDQAEQSVLKAKLVAIQIGRIRRSATEGFAKLTHNDGGSDRWYNYEGKIVANHHLRQQKAGAELRWQTPPVAEGSSKRVAFVFLGAMGYVSQPKTEGFALLVQDKQVLRFDLSKDNALWQSDDGKVECLFQPTWTSGADAAGFFYLSVSRDLLTTGKPCRIGVRSLGSGSARWFALHPVTDVVKLQTKPASATDGANPSDSTGRDNG